MERKIINMKKHLIITKILALSGLLLLFYQNCSNSLTPMNLDEPSISSFSGAELQVAALDLLENKCATCHNSTMAAGGIDYITDLNALIYYRDVVATEPMLSPLYTVLANDDQHMSLLTQQESDLIFRWISDSFVQPPTVTPPSGGGAPIASTYSSIASQVLNFNCNGCHGATANQTGGGLNFTTHANIMATGSVIAGSANNSLFYQSLVRTAERMPLNGSALTNAEIQAIADWINAGARND